MNEVKRRTQNMVALRNLNTGETWDGASLPRTGSNSGGFPSFPGCAWNSLSKAPVKK